MLTSIARRLEDADEKIDRSRALVTRLVRKSLVGELALLARIHRCMRESNQCMRRMDGVLNANRALLGLGECGGANEKGDAAYRRFMEGLRDYGRHSTASRKAALR